MESWNRKNEGKATIRHFVIGGNPGEEAIKFAGAIDQVDLYRKTLGEVMKWSGLSSQEVEGAIKDSPDTIENTTIPNYKSLFLEALERIRTEK